MNGVLNINKPAGMTSHDVVYRVRKVCGQKRVGHAGTLDPDATGVLLVCLGHATRLSDLLADRGKQYDATLRLGVTTTTEDSSGVALETVDPSGVTEEQLLSKLSRFVGSIDQIPPMVSAVHHRGKRLYDLARQGIVVEREARTIKIDSIELISFTSGSQCSAHLRVTCGKGTYIRTLCANIGATLYVGGHMASLRRTSVGNFRIVDAVQLDELTYENAPRYLTSSSDAVSFLERLDLDAEQKADALNGKKIAAVGEFVQGTLMRLVCGAELVSLARVVGDGTLQPEKVFPE